MPDDAPRLFLITPVLTDGATFAPMLEAALEAADVACLLIRSGLGEVGGTKALVRALAPIAQRRGVACLVEDDPRLAVRAEADGVHFAGAGPGLREALDTLRPGRIVGVGGLPGRDAAMAAGEAGVDYLMFGGPDEDGDLDGVCERVAWWAAIFNVPCVGYARDPADATAVATAGAEFVALCEGVWTSPEAATRTLAAVAQAILPFGEVVR